MGTWNATIFGNDTSLDIKEEFFERYNGGEEPATIKNDLTMDLMSCSLWHIVCGKLGN